MGVRGRCPPYALSVMQILDSNRDAILSLHAINISILIRIVIVIIVIVTIVITIIVTTDCPKVLPCAFPHVCSDICGLTGTSLGRSS